MIEDSIPIETTVKRSHVIVALALGLGLLAALAALAGPASTALGAGALLSAAAAGALHVIRRYEIVMQRCERSAARLRLAAAVYANSSEAMLVTNANARILTVNRAFERITGYAAAQVVGRNPSFQSSGRQDASFYEAMWAALLGQGTWQGEIWNRRSTGETYAVWQTITAVRNTTGQITHYVSLFSDIQVLKDAEEELRHLAYHDPLTGLSNRLLFRNALDQAIARSERHNRKLVLMFVDLDHFKAINDTFGHACGDLLLEKVAQCLRNSLRAEDIVARMGGDEFAVLLENMTSKEEIAHLAGKLIAAIGQPVLVGARSLSPSASIGIALLPQDAANAKDLMNAADVALYRAKAAGRRTHAFHACEPSLQASHLSPRQ